MWNFIKGAYTHVPIQVVEFIRDQVKLIGSCHYTEYFEYDYPNIERHLESIVPARGLNSVALTRGGYLRAALLDSVSRASGWADTPLEDLSQWPDFSKSSKLIFPLRDMTGLKTMVNNPKRPDFYRAIAS